MSPKYYKAEYASIPGVPDPPFSAGQSPEIERLAEEGEGLLDWGDIEQI